MAPSICRSSRGGRPPRGCGLRSGSKGCARSQTSSLNSHGFVRAICLRSWFPVLAPLLYSRILPMFPNKPLVVHPANLGHLWHEANARAAWRAVAAPAPPDKRMLVGIPISRRLPHGSSQVLPGREPPPLEGQRTEHLPPRLDQVEVGGVGGLEDELPARMGQAEEQHVVGMVDVEIVQDGVHPLHLSRHPGIDPLQEADPIDDGAAAIVLGAGVPGGWAEGAEEGARAPSAIVQLRLGPLGRPAVHGAHLLAGKRLGRLGSQLVQIDHDAAFWWRAVELFNRPLFRAKSGSTRAPNQVSCSRQRSPSACRISWIRLCLMWMPRASCR